MTISTFRLSAVAGILAVVIPLSGCGTRMSEEKIAAADGSAISSEAAANAAAALGTNSDVMAPGAVAPGAAIPGATGAGTAAAPGASGTAVTTATAAAVPGAADGASARGGGAKGAPKTEAGGASAATGANAPCSQTLPPIVLGQSLAISGIVGSVTYNLRSGLALWLRDVNARGGIQCHPVQLHQMDDAADPARVTSNLTQLVKVKKAVAIVAGGWPTTLAAARQFAERNKVPLVGGDLVETTWFASPWLFPQGGSALASYAGSIKAAAKSVNGSKGGLMYCTEATICGTMSENFENMAKAAGVQPVSRRSASITAPDYTAECQAFKAAGVDTLFVGMDGGSSSRMTRSCLSHGYTPAVATSALAMSEQTSTDPNVRKLKYFLGTGVAPYLSKGNAGVDEFSSAYAKFAGGARLDQNWILAWAAGKLFERALTNVFQKARSGPVTPQLVAEGLWQMKVEMLNGLAPGMSYVKDAPPVQNDCYYLLQLTDVGYTAPFSDRRECLSGLARGF